MSVFLTNFCQNDNLLSPPPSSSSILLRSSSTNFSFITCKRACSTSDLLYAIACSFVFLTASPSSFMFLKYSGDILLSFTKTFSFCSLVAFSLFSTLNKRSTSTLSPAVFFSASVIILSDSVAVSERRRLNITKAAIAAVIPTAIAPIGLAAILTFSLANALPVLFTAAFNALKPNNILGITFPTIVPNISKRGPIAAVIPATTTIIFFASGDKSLNPETNSFSFVIIGVITGRRTSPSSVVKFMISVFNARIEPLAPSASLAACP